MTGAKMGNYSHITFKKTTAREETKPKTVLIFVALVFLTFLIIHLIHLWRANDENIKHTTELNLIEKQ